KARQEGHITLAVRRRVDVHQLVVAEQRDDRLSAEFVAKLYQVQQDVQRVVILRQPVAVDHIAQYDEVIRQAFLQQRQEVVAVASIRLPLAVQVADGVDESMQ